MTNDYSPTPSAGTDIPGAGSAPISIDEGQEHMPETKAAGAKVRDDAASLASDAHAFASTAAKEGKAYVGAVASDASSAFADAVESNKTAGADAVAKVARSAKEAADGLDAQAPQIAQMVRSAAGGVEKISTDIRDKSVGELFDTVTDFAKRQPAAFFGCGIVAGIVLSRLMRSPDRSA